MQPLRGIDVLDFTQSIAGPICTQSLAVLGANVVKVEPPEGDAFRPLIEGSMFASCNRGKRSISLDLKSESGRAIARDLAADADVVVESFRPGVMEGFGLGYEDLSAENDDIVYCSITGFGQDGPYEEYPAYDPVAQAMSGLMSVTGPTDGDPVRVGTSAIDYSTGLTGAMLVMGGLIGDGSESGTHIDLSLFDVATTWMGYWVAHYTSTDELPKRAGAGLYGMAPYGIFEAGDGQPFYLATASEKLYGRLCDTLERPDLLEDDRFGTAEDRWENRDVLRAELESEFGAFDRRELVESLAESGIPVGPLQSIDELVDDDPMPTTGTCSSRRTISTSRLSVGRRECRFTLPNTRLSPRRRRRETANTREPSSAKTATTRRRSPSYLMRVSLETRRNSVSLTALPVHRPPFEPSIPRSPAERPARIASETVRIPLAMLSIRFFETRSKRERILAFESARITVDGPLSTVRRLTRSSRSIPADVSNEPHSKKGSSGGSGRCRLLTFHIMERDDNEDRQNESACLDGGRSPEHDGNEHAHSDGFDADGDVPVVVDVEVDDGDDRDERREQVDERQRCVTPH